MEKGNLSSLVEHSAKYEEKESKRERKRISSSTKASTKAMCSNMSHVNEPPYWYYVPVVSLGSIRIELEDTAVISFFPSFKATGIMDLGTLMPQMPCHCSHELAGNLADNH